MPFARESLSDTTRTRGSVLQRIVQQFRNQPLIVLMDYDGTLVPIAETPDRAVPDRDVIALLAALAARPQTDLHIVSGRPREPLASWFAPLPISIWAEHGFWHRPGSNQPWEAANTVLTDWLNKVRPIIDHFTATTPGSLLEQKTAGFAWHYRRAEPVFGARQADALRTLLADALEHKPLEVLEGKKVIEVRMRGVNKALVAERVLSLHKPGTAVLAIGDDQTDEDLFGALPDSSVTIAVGDGPSLARYSVDDHLAVRRLLRALLTA